MRQKSRMVLSIAAVVFIGISVGVYAIAKWAQLPLPFLSDSCRAFGDDNHVVRLEPEQLHHAATIVAVGTRMGVPPRAVTVALATAWQESSLENLPGGDRDSVGLFQQRPSQGWGSVEQISQPRYSAETFYTALLKVPHWDTMAITEAAQAVQLSAHPNAYGKWESKARTLAHTLLGQVDAGVSCVLRRDGGLRGIDAEEKIRREFEADYGLNTAGTSGGSVSVAADTPSAGWQRAHWFVAKSRAWGVRQVTYDGMKWEAKTGTWDPVDSAATHQVFVQLAK